MWLHKHAGISRVWTVAQLFIHTQYTSMESVSFVSKLLLSTQVPWAFLQAVPIAKYESCETEIKNRCTFARGYKVMLYVIFFFLHSEWGRCMELCSSPHRFLSHKKKKNIYYILLSLRCHETVHSQKASMQRWVCCLMSILNCHDMLKWIKMDFNGFLADFCWKWWIWWVTKGIHHLNLQVSL